MALASTGSGASADAGLRLRVLGSIAATQDGAPVDLGGPRQRAVLARLVLGRGGLVSSRAAGRGAVGRRAAGGRHRVPADLHLAPAPAAAAGPAGPGPQRRHLQRLRRIRPAPPGRRGGRLAVRGAAAGRPRRLDGRPATAPSGCCRRRSRCGAAPRYSRPSATQRGPRREIARLTELRAARGGAAARRASARRASRRCSSPSSSSWSTRSRCARSAGGCWCSRSTAPAGRPMRWPRCGARGRCSPTSSASTRARRCARWRPRCSPSRRPSTPGSRIRGERPRRRRPSRRPSAGTQSGRRRGASTLPGRARRAGPRARRADGLPRRRARRAGPARAGRRAGRDRQEPAARGGPATWSTRPARCCSTARCSELEREFGFGAVRQLFEPLLADPARRDGAAARVGGRAPGPCSTSTPTPGRLTPEESSFATLHGLYWLTSTSPRTARRARRRRPALVRQRLAALPHLPRPPAGGPAGAPRRHGAHRRGAGDAALLEELRHRRGDGADPRRAAERSAGCGASSPPAWGRTGRGLHAAPASTPPPATRCCCGSCCARSTPRACGPTPRTPTPPGRSAPGRSAAWSCCGCAGCPPAATAVARALAVLGDGAPLPVVAALAGLDEDAAAGATAGLARAEVLRAEAPLAFVHALVRAAVLPRPRPRASGSCCTTARPGCSTGPGAPAEQVAAQLLLAPPRADGWAVEVLRPRGRRGDAPRCTRTVPPATCGGRWRSRPRRSDRAEVLLELARAEVSAGRPGGAGAPQEAYAALTDPARRAAPRSRWPGPWCSPRRVARRRPSPATPARSCPESLVDERQGLLALGRISVHMHGLDAAAVGAGRRRPSRARAGRERAGRPDARRPAGLGADVRGHARARQAIPLAERALADGSLYAVDNGLLWVVATTVQDLADVDVMPLWDDALALAHQRGLAVLGAVGLAVARLLPAAPAGDLPEAEESLRVAAGSAGDVAGARRPGARLRGRRAGPGASRAGPVRRGPRRSGGIGGADAPTPTGPAAARGGGRDPARRGALRRRVPLLEEAGTHSSRICATRPGGAARRCARGAGRAWAGSPRRWRCWTTEIETARPLGRARASSGALLRQAGRCAPVRCRHGRPRRAATRPSSCWPARPPGWSTGRRSHALGRPCCVGTRPTVPGDGAAAAGAGDRGELLGGPAAPAGRPSAGRGGRGGPRAAPGRPRGLTSTAAAHRDARRRRGAGPRHRASRCSSPRAGSSSTSTEVRRAARHRRSADLAEALAAASADAAVDLDRSLDGRPGSSPSFFLNLLLRALTGRCGGTCSGRKSSAGAPQDVLRKFR